LFPRKLGSFDACTNFCKGGFSGRGKIITKGRKSAIVGCSELDQRYEVKRLQHAVSHLLGSFDFWIDWVDTPTNTRRGGCKFSRTICRTRRLSSSLASCI